MMNVASTGVAAAPAWRACLSAFAGLALALASSVSTGCSTTSRIEVRSTPRTNDGNTLYMMVRAADKVTAAENYQDVAAKLFADPPDPSVIASQPIFPGNTATFTLDEADKKDVVIYFFFTDPGTNWRMPLRRPLPAEVFIDLGIHQIERAQVRRR